MSKLTKLRTASYGLLGEWAYQEITTLRTQLAEAQAEVQEQARLNGMGAEREAKLMAQLEEVTRERDDYKKAVDDLGLTPEEARAGAKRSRDMKQQLLTTQANAARLKETLEDTLQTLCWQCFGECRNITPRRILEPNEAEIKARAALSTPTNLDALHEDRAEFIDDVAKRLLTEVCFKMGSGSPYRKMLHDYINTLREQAAAHRTKKESK